MKTLLRYSFMALLAMVVVPSFAQEVTLDFTAAEPDSNPWGLPTAYVKDAATYTNNGITISLGESNNGHKQNAGYLIFGKQNATLSLPAFSFDVERIDIVGNSGASAATKQNIFVGEDAVSTETTGAQGTNQYKIAAGKQTAGTIYTLKVTSNHNTQITKIMIWKKGTATGGDDPVTPAEPQEINVTEALNIINGLESGKTTTEEYLVKGFIVGAPDFQRKGDGSLYGNVNFSIANEKGGTNLLTVFRAQDKGNVKFTEETISSLNDGDEVIIRGKLQNYVKDNVTTPELTNCYIISVNSSGSGVQAVNAESIGNNKSFNLSGQRVRANYKGLVIKDGKKYMSN